MAKSQILPPDRPRSSVILTVRPAPPPRISRPDGAIRPRIKRHPRLARGMVALMHRVKRPVAVEPAQQQRLRRTAPPPEQEV